MTGSGKTEVYLRLVARALDDESRAILLVPEIAYSSDDQPGTEPVRRPSRRITSAAVSRPGRSCESTVA